MESLISILIPCRNEERYIETCLATVLKFIVPEGVQIEILILDGLSVDRTRQLVEAAMVHDPRIRLISNPGRIQSTALNLALEVAQGEWIMRLDAHSFYPPEYLQLCLETARRTGADNVGGLFITQRGGDTYEAGLVQALTTHKFGVGNSGFRTGEGEGPADTVPYGFYRRALFDRVGKLDERLVRAQDYEFNRRVVAAGGRIWRNPCIHVHYHNQPTMRLFLAKQYFMEAPYNAYLWYVAPYAFAWRHAITGIFAFGVIGGLAISPFSSVLRTVFLTVIAFYGCLALLSAIQQAIRYREPRHVVALPVGFFLYHFLHGCGVLMGLARLATGGAPVQQRSEPWPGAGAKRIDPARLPRLACPPGGPVKMN